MKHTEKTDQLTAFQGNFNVFVYFFLLGAFVWTLICIFLKAYFLAVFPLGYIAAVGLVFISQRWGTSFRAVRFVCTLLSISLPFVFQWLAGGYHATGVVMVWALLAVLAAVSFHQSNEGYFWLLFYLLLLVGSWIFEPDFNDQTASILGQSEVSSLLTLINLFLISVALFILSEHIKSMFLKKIDQLSNLNDRYNSILLEKEKSLQRFFNTQKDFFEANEELQKTKDQLERSQIELKVSLDAINSTLLGGYLTADGKIISVNNCFERITKYSGEELSGHYIWDFFDGKDHFLPNKLSEGRIYTCEQVILDKDQHPIWIQLTFNAIRDRQGQIEKYIFLAQDISQAEQIRLDYVSRYEAVENFNSVAEIDLKGNIIAVNELYAACLHYEPDELIGKPYNITFADKNTEHTSELMRHILLNGYIVSESERKSKNGSSVWFFSILNIVKDRKGQPYKIVEISQNITRRKILEIELTASKKRIETLNDITLAHFDDPVAQIRELMAFCCQSMGFDTAVLGFRIGQSDYFSAQYVYSSPQDLIAPHSRIKVGTLKAKDDLEISNLRFAADIEDLGDCDFDSIKPKSFISSQFNTPIGDALFVLLARENKPVLSDSGVSFLLLFIRWLSSAANASLYQAELRKLSLVASKTNNAVIITDKDGYIEWVNDGFSIITGYRLDEVIGKKPGSFLQGELTNPQTVAEIRRGLQMQAPFYSELVNYHKLGLPYWINLQITPIFDKTGNLERFIAIQADITERKNVEERLKQTNQLLVTQQEQLKEVNNALELKNKQINDSLRYAFRIQQAALGEPEEAKGIVSEMMVLYLPQTIVSGDFYWFSRQDNKLVVAVVDCTGHGVPGGFMTMMTAAFLENIVNSQKILQPHLILENLDRLVSKTLKQADTKNQDGMDIGILVFDKETNAVNYAGAKINLEMVVDGKLEVVEAARRHIGGINPQIKFISHQIQVQQPTCFYMATDGYRDQFGGQPEQKFGLKRVRELLVSISHQDMNEQKQVLRQTIKQWIEDGNIKKQIDDILVVGILFR